MKLFWKFILVFTIASVTFSSQVSASTKLFSDLQEDAVGYNEIKFLIDEQILTADETKPFGVKEQATRYDVAYFLAKSLNLEIQEDISESLYSDVLLDDDRLPYIHAVANAKLMNGYKDGTFDPDKPITRTQLANLLVKAYSLKGVSNPTIFDVTKTNASYNAILTVVSNQIMTLSPNMTFKPNDSVSKVDLAIFIARSLEPSLRASGSEANACVQETKQTTYRVDVAVSNLWQNYGQNRSVDAPSMTNPINYSKWISSMSLAQKKWLVGKTDTQALYNDEVKLLKSKGNMHYVAAVDQYVPYNDKGYPGWVPKSHIVKTNVNTSDCSIAIVTAKKTTLYNEVNKKAFLEISYATILPVVKKENGYYYVQTPNNGVKLLKTSDAKHYASYKSVPKPSQEDIVNTAKRFLGLKYLWAGTSSWGYDCSGIIYAAYRAHGIMIPRDSFYQATKGKAVSKKNLQPGDLVFFAYNNGKGKVYHVGLYIGNGQMLHAPHYASQVKIEKLDSGVYKKNYAGARRYLN